MAFLNSATLKGHRQQSALLFRNLTPAVAESVGRALSSSINTEGPSKSTGPVRYIQKPLPDEGPGCRQGLLAGSSDSRPDGNAKADRKRGNFNVSMRQLRGDGRKFSSDPSCPQTFLGIVPPGNDSKISKLEMEPKGEPDITLFGLDSEQSLRMHGSLNILKQEDSVSGGGKAPLKKLQAANTSDDPSSRARNYAIALLVRGPQTELNLRSKLMKRNIPSQIVDDTIEHLKICGLQNDEEYTEMFARSRWIGNTWGPLRIKYELLRKGIRKEMVEAVLANLFQKSDRNEEEEEYLVKWGMTTQAAEHLICKARQRWAQGDMEMNVRRRRMTGWLERRSFSWTVISDILRIVECESPVDFE